MHWNLFRPYFLHYIISLTDTVVQQVTLVTILAPNVGPVSWFVIRSSTHHTPVAILMEWQLLLQTSQSSVEEQLTSSHSIRFHQHLIGSQIQLNSCTASPRKWVSDQVSTFYNVSKPLTMAETGLNVVQRRLWELLQLLLRHANTIEDYITSYWLAVGTPPWSYHTQFLVQILNNSKWGQRTLCLCTFSSLQTHV